MFPDEVPEEIRPDLDKQSFLCPHCGVVSQMLDAPIVDKSRPVHDVLFDPRRYGAKRCACCGRLSFWADEKMVYPYGTGIIPSREMPEDVKKIFCEAQSIANLSPRSACALFRVCLERIVTTVGAERGIEFKKGENLYSRVKKLSLPENLEKICDACRHSGNESAHSGQLNLSDEDTQKIAYANAFLVNAIVGYLIAPKAIAERVLKRLDKM